MSFSGLIPELQPYAKQLVAECGSAGLLPRITSTRRSTTEQKRLYQKFLAGLSQYPAAAPGTSAHEFGWAFDMVVTPMAALADVGQLWESWGGVWGGRFHDPVHFEFPGFQAPAAVANDYWGGIYRAASLASYVATPLSVERGRPEGYGTLAAGIERLLGL